MSDCHPDRPMVAKGMCNACYQRHGRTPATCHPDKPMVARGLCRACYQREMRKDPEVRQRWERYRKDNSRKADCHPDRPHYGRGMCSACFQAEWRAQNLDKVNGRQYGLSAEEVAAMREQQGGRCAICRIEAPLMVDHCHQTGAARGLLCRRCNSALGWVRDDTSILQAMIEYLHPLAA